jgi:predicted dehydrogenase
MALKLGDAHRMAEACDRHGVHLTIGFVRRFDTFWGCMRKIVESGVLGGPVVWRSASAGHQSTVWMRNVDKGGGPLMDGGVHNYDFALQMLGPAESVQASSVRFDATSVGGDTTCAIVNFVAGHQLCMNWSWGMPQGVHAGGLDDILGPAGALPIRPAIPDKAPKSFDPKRHSALIVSTEGGAQRVRTYRQQDMFLQQLKHVCRHFARDTQPLVTAADGIKALEVAVAVLKSARTKRTVRL